MAPKSEDKSEKTSFQRVQYSHIFPTAYTKSLLKEMVECAQLTSSRGWHPGTAGNFSVRQDKSICWLSPSGVDKGKLLTNNFLPISIANSSCKGFSNRKPSAETPLHTAIYRLDPRARAVIHAHPFSTVAMIQQTEIFTENEIIKAFGLPSHQNQIKIPCVPNTQDMDGLASTLNEFADMRSKVFVLQNHGIYAWGETPGEALSRIESLDFLCQIRVIHERTDHRSD